jgi:uncharacterized protein YndB with AHSA1/START domain
MNDETSQGWAEFPGPGEIRYARILACPIARAWEHLTDPEKRAGWLAGGPMELRGGGRVELQWDHARLTPHAETIPEKYLEMCAPGSTTAGRVTRCEPPRYLSFTWAESGGGSSEVSFELTPRGDQTNLALIHRGLGDDPAMLTGAAAGWHAHTGILNAKLAGVEPAPFWATHARLEAGYEKLLAASKPGGAQPGKGP